tara:strand:+ start:259 stop:684 length:426 start_codon:yes stop_codon:yes gene_type:complete
MKKGLYANIYAKKKRIKAGSGEKMKKVGAKGAPTAKDFKNSAKTAKKKSYTKEGVASYKKQLAKSKKMPKSTGNDSKESTNRIFPEDSYTQYAPKMKKTFFGEGGVEPQRNQINKAQEKQKKKKREKKKLTPSKPQKGYSR